LFIDLIITFRTAGVPFSVSVIFSIIPTWFFCARSRVARFLMLQYTKERKSIPHWLQNYRMPLKYTQWS
jgi:hypothetical protein